jgi:hypothetical protein
LRGVLCIARVAEHPEAQVVDGSLEGFDQAIEVLTLSALGSLNPLRGNLNHGGLSSLTSTA